MNVARFWRHILMSPLTARRCFGPQVMSAIEREIGVQEKRHRGEIRFVVEAELTSAQLWVDLSSRDRARQVFAEQGVWNTEENTGVLIYLLLADRRVEVVADRGITARVPETEWQAICRTMEGYFRDGRFEEGALAGIRAVSGLLAQHFPVGADNNADELPNRPILM